ncbi:metal-dependent hydrolase [Aureimonas fodinaquatilis]|uniref:UPF0173 metal-dependent hydrolase FPY71_06270 n=1 Tax=Aureimonas fodinaquatilis TaxID=2565783 RepID=A0A5B0DY53_9HYPH|nr:metal-dependent hydrolase [Aureimonas fodinaquatilis]KAA0970139.1 metal-dependent hydrolase [Aureimonas fodinaquatilis]
MRLTYYGHSAFRIDTDRSSILVDPFISGNGHFKGSLEEVAEGITHIALTHGHADHVGDTVEIARRTNAVVIGNFELVSWLGSKGVARTEPGNTGGTLHFEDFSVTFTQAFHSSGQVEADGSVIDLGSANGLVFHFAKGPTIYHMGDTDIFGDMALVQELHQPQIGLVPIGDRFTMGGAVAALACRRYFRFEKIVPIHWGTFPLLDQTADGFVEAMEDAAKTVLAPQIGVAFDIQPLETA